MSKFKVRTLGLEVQNQIWKFRLVFSLGQNPGCPPSAPHCHHRYRCCLWFLVQEPAGPEEAVWPQNKWSMTPKAFKQREKTQWDKFNKHKGTRVTRLVSPGSSNLESSKRCVVRVEKETEEGNGADTCWLYRAGPGYGGVTWGKSMKVLVLLSRKRAMKWTLPTGSRNSDFNISSQRGLWLPKTRVGFVSVR